MAGQVTTNLQFQNTGTLAVIDPDTVMTGLKRIMQKFIQPRQGLHHRQSVEVKFRD
jgi:hypothetical protein